MQAGQQKAPFEDASARSHKKDDSVAVMSGETKEYDKWVEQLEAGEYGEVVAIEPNPYYRVRQEPAQAQLPVADIAKKNNE
jgi:hypothetical protein